ncbi:MAG: ferritin-like domain-containing protein [Acidobacteriota bacterium]
MPETVRNRINNYLEDAIAAERNFEDALHSFGKTGVQEPVRALLAAAGDKARTQHQRLTALLEQRGGSPSTAKSALAHMLAFSTLTAQAGHEPGEKNTQHLIVTFGAAGAEQAMYQALAEAGAEAGDTAVVSLARQLQSEEADDARQVWPLLRTSARNSFREAVGAGRSPSDVLRSYLEDIIAAEKSFETQLTAFSKEGDYAPAQTAFAQHAQETRAQYERLTSRLEAIGGTTSTAKGILAQVFGAAPKLAQAGHDASERTTQNLMIAYAVENAEMAMYEVFCAVAADAGDHETGRVGAEIQQQEKETAEKVWKLVGPAARRSIQQVTLRKAS